MAYGPGSGREYRVPAWAGPWAWADELERQARIMRCSSGHHRRFEATARHLTAWRIRSAAQCSPAAIARILPMLEAARRDYGRRLLGERSCWSDAELGELIVEARNRLTLAALGRDRARPRGPRMDPASIPDDRLEALIQRHANLELVDQLRSERQRRTRVTSHTQA